MSTEDLETRRDVKAALAARRELGVEYEDAIAASLAERVERLAAVRSAEHLQLTEQTQANRSEAEASRSQSFVLAIISLGAGIPVTAIAATNVDPGLLGVLVSWTGIVAVNVAFNWRNRRSS